jgi:glycosyltransferase involved in cell wall biosynthesis
MIGPDKDGSLAVTQHLAQQLGLEVNFPGKMSKEAWRALSVSYDIFINTTHFDNVPISVIEAMALGLPVVSTDVGGIPFLLEDHKTALLVQDNDVQEMAQAIFNLVESAQLSQQLSAAARLEAQNYSWSNVKVLWEQLLDEIPKKG